MLSYTYHNIVSYIVSLLFCMASYVMLHVFFFHKLVLFYLIALYALYVNALCPNSIKCKNLNKSKHLVFVIWHQYSLTVDISDFVQ